MNEKYDSEVAFWNWVMNISEPDKEFLLSKISGNGEHAIQPIMKNLLDIIGYNIDILDVGCGPVTDNIWAFKEKGSRIICVDPLNDTYVEMLNKLGYDHPLISNLITARVEDLSNILTEKFDVVYTKNALDHVDDVVQSINVLFNLTRDEGYIYIAFHTKEGTNQKWEGLHKHNLWIEDNSILYQNQNMGSEYIKLVEPSEILQVIIVDNNSNLGKLSTVVYKKVNN